MLKRRDSLCTFGKRTLIDAKILDQVIQRENKFNRSLFRDYKPNLSVNPVSGKFYSKYENPHLDSNTAVEKITEYVDKINYARSKVPKEKFDHPVLESHVYNWFEEDPLNKMKRLDRRFHHPHVECAETKYWNLIRSANK